MINKEQAKKLIDGWEIICKYNQKYHPDKIIKKEDYIETFFEVVNNNDCVENG